MQTLIGIGFALWLAFSDFRQTGLSQDITSESTNASWIGLGTAIFMIIIFGFVLAGAISLLRGHRWGRGPIVLLEIILLPIAFQMFSGGTILLGTVTVVTAALALIGIFHPRSIEWFSENYGR